jgi:hypothetical protein
MNVKEHIMSLWTDITGAGEKIETFLTDLQSGATKLKAVYAALSSATLPAIAAVFYDVVKTVAAATAAGTAAESGNFTGAITLSETTITLVKQVVADFKAGEKAVVADFDALGIKI